MQSQRPIPVRPVYPDDAGSSTRALTRAVAAMAISRITWPERGSAEAVLQRMWPDDRAALTVLRAASAPITTATAAALMPTTVASFVSGLVQTAAGALIARAMRLDLTGIGQINIPRALSDPALGFVGEGAPIPALQRALSTATLGPARKISGLAVLSNELAEHSAPNAEAVVGTLLQEAAARALDGGIFSATAASSVQPAGILNGIAAQTPTAGGGANAMVADVKNLIGAIADAGGGNAGVLLIANSRQIVTLKLLAGPQFDYPMLGSSVVPAGTVIAIDPAAFASGFDAVPEIAIGRSATIVQDDAPPQFSTPGTPNIVAAPSTSMFQVDSVSLRLTLRAGWCLRAPMVAWVQTATW